MLLKSGRRLNEMDTFFLGHSKLKEGLYRFAGCFECANPGVSLDHLRRSLQRLIDRYPEIFLFDPARNQRTTIAKRTFVSEREQRDFYSDCLSKPVAFGNVLLQVWLLDKADGSRAIFLLIPHFAGDSKIAIFVLGHILGTLSENENAETLQFVSYGQMALEHMSTKADMVCSVLTEASEMVHSFAWTSPRKGKMDVATRFLEEHEFKMVNRARRKVGFSRSLLLQVAALHAYRLLAPPERTRVFNIIYDNTPGVPTLNNCFRSMPLVIPLTGADMTLEATGDLFKAMQNRYERPRNRYAFLFRSLLARIMPLGAIRVIFPRTTRGVQHYISYVFLDGKLSLLPGDKGGHRVWGNIEPVGYSLSNFNVVEFEKQISLNITWDTNSLGARFGDDLLNAIVGIFQDLDKDRTEERKHEMQRTPS